MHARAYRLPNKETDMVSLIPHIVTTQCNLIMREKTKPEHDSQNFFFNGEGLYFFEMCLLWYSLVSEILSWLSLTLEMRAISYILNAERYYCLFFLTRVQTYQRNRSSLGASPLMPIVTT